MAMRHSVLLRLIMILVALCSIPMYLTYFQVANRKLAKTTYVADDDVIIPTTVTEKQTTSQVATTSVATTTTTTEITTTEMPFCPEESPLMNGPLHVFFEAGNETKGNWPPTLEETSRKYLNVELGGYYPGPDDCRVPAKQNVAIIIPFRGRDEHLKYLLHYLHGILQRQQMRYVVVVAEQDDKEPFNKAQMMNTAFQYIMSEYKGTFDCVAFHDVDTLSEDDRTLYRCDNDDNNVVHLAHRIDKYNYKFCCGITVGGVLLMKRNQFEKINGFSNQYFGWGAEDDDAAARIEEGGKFKIVRPQAEYYRFKMIKHPRDENNEAELRRFDMLKKWKNRMMTDGLNSLDTRLKRVVKYYTHTRLYIKPSTVRN